MRIILTIFIVIALGATLAGQSAEDESIRLKQEGALQVEGTAAGDMHSEAETVQRKGEDENRSGSLGLSVGTAYSFSKGVGSGMMFYAAPTYTLPLNNRWSLHTGFIARHHQGLNPVYGEFYSPLQYSSLAFFAAASYQMNERLVLHGTGVKQLVSAPITPLTAYPMDHISLGATYKLGNNITIGATLQLNNGHGIYSNPYQGYGFAPPFYW
jgi:hypothetical protein